MSSKLNTAIAVAGIDIGENSFHVEAEDVKGTVAALDFAIAIIGTVPPVEDFNDLDPMPDQCITQGRSIRWRWVRCLIRQSMANEENDGFRQRNAFEDPTGGRTSKRYCRGF